MYNIHIYYHALLGLQKLMIYHICLWIWSKHGLLSWWS